MLPARVSGVSGSSTSISLPCLTILGFGWFAGSVGESLEQHGPDRIVDCVIVWGLSGVRLGSVAMVFCGDSSSREYFVPWVFQIEGESIFWREVVRVRRLNKALNLPMVVPT